MVSCYVVGCKSGNNGSKSHQFKISKRATEETRRRWIKNIPKQKHRPWNFETCHLCDLHFEEKYIVKVNRVYFNEEVIAEETRKAWKLTDDAVPTKFSNAVVPKYYNNPHVERKTPAVRKPLQPKNQNVIETSSLIKATDFEEFVEINHEPHTAKTFIESIPSLPLPENWFYQKSENLVKYIKIVQDTAANSDICMIERELHVNSNFEWRCIIRKLEVKVDNLASLNKLEDIPTALSICNAIKTCNGIENFNAVRECQDAVRFGSAWFSLDCSIIISEGPCESCKALKPKLINLGRKTLQPKVNKVARPDPLKLLSKASRTIKRLTVRVQTMRQELMNLRTEVKKLNADRLGELIEKDATLPPPMKASLIAAARLAKCKSLHGMRYANDWLLQCLLLKITSPKAYRFLRNNKILALPHPKHLCKLLRGVPCEFGFNELVFTELEKQYRGKEQRDRQFIITFDEIKVRESIQFDRIAGKFMGFVDYAEFTDDYKRSARTKAQEADHALVFMIRNLNSNMVQPIGSFASRGAAPGHILAKLITSAIVKLEAVNCEVIGVVCDGATTNKSLWKLLGISGNPNKIVSSITNPCDDNRDVFFFHDVPHIIKCIRNHLLKYEIAKFCGKQINWGLYRAVFKFDQEDDLHLAPKLTKHHLEPGPFQKMIVSYTTQIFSKTMADAIQFFREKMKNRVFKGSEWTEHFTRTLNDIFDILNAKLPHEGIRLGSTQMQTLEEFLELLCTGENTFASETTMNSLRVTLKSAISLIKYLCNVLKFSYVLTVKFNQDCLERFFGILRSFGGDDSHPTVISFGHLFRILSMYAPIKWELNGNIRTNEESELALDPFIAELKSLAKASAKERQDIRDGHKEQLKRKMVNDDVEVDAAEFDQEGCVVFYLCGYVASRAKKFTTCIPCQNTLKTNASALPVKAWVDIKSLGKLTYPSDNFYTVIRDSVEPVIASQLQSRNISSETFLEDVIKDLPPLNVKNIGCSSEHTECLAVEVVLFYVTMRCFFYRNIHNWKSVNAGEERKKKMKQAKLT